MDHTGSGEYCDVNNLHICLRAAGAGTDLPDPGFLECLAVMPFGARYFRLLDGSVALLSPITIEPDAGLTLALDALGLDACGIPRGNCGTYTMKPAPCRMTHFDPLVITLP